jgi:glycosyltransferase involved in cell wall biosynthesis
VLKIAFVTSEAREAYRDYSNPIPTFGTAPKALLTGFEELSGLEVHVISCIQTPVNAPAKIGKNLFYHSLVVPKMGWLRTGYFGCTRAVRRLLDRLQPDLVHGQGTERECALATVFSGRRNLLTIHGNMRRIARVNEAKPFSFLWITAQLEGFALRRAGGVVCITEHTKREVGKLAKRAWVIPNAVNADFFNVERRPARPATFVCPATISPLKNQLRLIEAVDSIAGQGRFRFVFAGLLYESAYATEFQRLISSRPWCEYVGFVKPPEMRKILESASGLVLPSLEENCPMAILEAMAAGVPVLAARVGGIPELIEHERTGLLFDPLSTAGILASVEQLLKSPDKTAAMAAAATEEAGNRFHPVRVARQHLDLYQAILARS